MDQTCVINFLNTPEAYGLGAGEEVGRFDTHISVVFVAGEFAYKLKRAIQLPFVDFRALADREKYCRLELGVNQAGAPGLYLDVVAVTLDQGKLSLGGTGEVKDWLVKMKRFDQDMLFDHLCHDNQLSAARMDELCDHLMDVYKNARQDFEYGGAAGMRRAFEGHYKAMDSCPEGLLPAAKVDLLKISVETQIRFYEALLNDRQETGFVRQCHGDLHLRNICLHDDQIMLFDAIEFEPDYAVIDILYDLSFLIMDLCHRGRRDLANVVMNRYLALSGDVTGMNVLGLFLASRATIRTHVNAVASLNQDNPEGQARWQEDALTYLDEAQNYLSGPPAALIAIGGLSGSGKSVLAKALAPKLGRTPGAYIARTDMIRKRLMGVKPTEKLDAFGYSQRVTAHTYNTLFVEIRLALHAGYCVVVDGVFAKEEERKQLSEIAQAMNVPFVGLWLTAEAGILQERVFKRSNDASDADVDVVRMQAEYDLGQMDWVEIDATGSQEVVLDKARKILTDVVDLADE